MVHHNGIFDNSQVASVFAEVRSIQGKVRVPDVYDVAEAPTDDVVALALCVPNAQDAFLFVDSSAGFAFQTHHWQADLLF